MTVPHILCHGLKSSRLSHGYVGLWCRDQVELALSWCCQPHVQLFPCVAFEVLVAAANLNERSDFPVACNKKTKHAYCIQPLSQASGSEEDALPPVSIVALWVALPRSHSHAQDIARLHDAYTETVAWVVKESNMNTATRGEGRGGSRTNTWSGHLAQMVERRLTYWGLGGESENLPNVPWPRAQISKGLLILSLDCARCIRVAGGDLRRSEEWEWARVPPPFREWLVLRRVTPTFFNATGGSEAVCKNAVSQWSRLREIVKAPHAAVRWSPLPAPEEELPAPGQPEHLLAPGDEEEVDWGDAELSS